MRQQALLILGLLSLAWGCAKASKVDLFEGSGEDDEDGSGAFNDDEEEVLRLVPDKEYEGEKDDIIDDDYYDDDYDSEDYFPEDEYLDDYDEALKSVLTEDDYDYTDNVDDSVLRFQPDIEIKPRPEIVEEDEDEEGFVFETSKLLLMIGSAFASFGFVMLVFFMCRRSMQQRAHKPVEIQRIRQGPIVKSYHRVPGSTLQYFESSHIDMYRGEQGAKQGQPLIE